MRKQLEKLEKLLAAGFAVDGVCYGVAWFVECLVLAPVPPEVLEALTAIGVDSTDLATWAVSKDFRKEKNVKKRKGTHPDESDDDQDASGVHDDGINAETLRRAAADPLVKHRLDSLVWSDLDEPDLKQQLPRGAVFGTQIGDFGPDDRLIRSRDPDARPGHKSAKGKSVAGFFLGYDLHLAVAVKGFRYHGDRAEATFGPEVLPFIVGISLKAAATNPAIAGLEAVAMARSVAPLIREVLADRAYTNKAIAFNRALHEMGIDVVMDYNKPEVQRDKLAVIAGKHQVRFHCGTCLHPSTPASMRTPPANLTGEALADWYTMRNRFYRYSVTQSYPDGRKRMKCPVHDQRIKTAATANTNHRDVPLMATPKGSNICCSGHVTMTLESLDKHQDTPYGTHAWLMSYARRNQARERQQRTQTHKRARRRIVRQVRLRRPRHRLSRSLMRAQHPPSTQIPRTSSPTRRRTRQHRHRHPRKDNDLRSRTALRKAVRRSQTARRLPATTAPRQPATMIGPTTQRPATRYRPRT